MTDTDLDAAARVLETWGTKPSLDQLCTRLVEIDQQVSDNKLRLEALAEEREVVAAYIYKEIENGSEFRKGVFKNRLVYFRETALPKIREGSNKASVIAALKGSGHADYVSEDYNFQKLRGLINDYLHDMQVTKPEATFDDAIPAELKPHLTSFTKREIVTRKG